MKCLEHKTDTKIGGNGVSLLFYVQPSDHLSCRHESCVFSGLEKTLEATYRDLELPFNCRFQNVSDSTYKKSFDDMAFTSNKSNNQLFSTMTAHVFCLFLSPFFFCRPNPKETAIFIAGFEAVPPRQASQGPAAPVPWKHQFLELSPQVFSSRL